ncbi:unnamed protein product [Cylindrotheca closterium]|uniref:DUF2828 domain-containing protein n=1 Tax=Cylindrotheca closterium TaxID=2856 RepID=A0AAD2CKZ6_9STRA|nr:unnamed protein product [Cylindrotheca closterium]
MQMVVWVILALSQLVRGGQPQELVNEILERGDTNEIVRLFVLTFVIRNTRGGKAEKKLSFDAFLHLLKHYPETAKALLPMFVHYGYWKDFLLLMEMAKEHSYYSALRDGVMELMKHQWHKDMSALGKYEMKLRDASRDETATDNLKKWGLASVASVSWPNRFPEKERLWIRRLIS